MSPRTCGRRVLGRALIDQANDQLALVVQFKNERFKEPFIVRTVFDRLTE